MVAFLLPFLWNKKGKYRGYYTIYFISHIEQNKNEAGGLYVK